MVNNTGNTAQATASVTLPWGGLLFIVLFILKVNPGGYLDSPVESWSWWWITAPIWGPFALVLAFILGALTVALIGVLIVEPISNRRAKKRRDKRLAERMKQNYAHPSNRFK